MRYVLGIDQGASKTHAMVADESGVVLGMGQSGGACHSSHGMERAMGELQEAARQALAQSGLDAGQLSAVTAGMTGLDWDFEKELLTKELQARFPCKRVSVVNDCIIALRAGTSKESGCVLCAGSGLNCAVRKNREQEYVFGFYIADKDQGGTALGQRAVQAVLDAECGLGEPTALTGMLLEYFGLSSVDELLYQTVVRRIGPGETIKLPPLLEQAAAQNDPVALHIFSRYGYDIARYAVAGMRRLGMLGDPVDVVLSGSIFKCKLPILEEAVASEIHRWAARAVVVNCRYEPIVGAVLLALEELQNPLSPLVYRNMEAASQQFPIVR